MEKLTPWLCGEVLLSFLDLLQPAKAMTITRSTDNKLNFFMFFL
jgi:hypothetical protein